MRRIDQGHARTAAKMLNGVDVDASLRTRYRTLRVMSHSAGLAATYAYIASKSGASGQLSCAYTRVLDGIGERLEQQGWIDSADTGDPRRVLERLGNLDAVDYLAASADATALLGWLARLGDALGGGDDA